MDKTESEIALEEFCDANGIHWERIPTEDAAGLKTPDYYIYSFGEQVAAEVKEIQPSPDEREQERHLKEKGWSTFGATPGARARAIIGTAGKQLRAKAKGTCPAMVVLYNPSFLLRHHTEPYAIRVAMYGLDAVVLGLPADMQQSPYLIDRKSGPKRKMTEEHNTSISAVAALQGRELWIYHNVFAAIPLKPGLFRGLPVRQFTLQEKRTGEFSEWKEIVF